MSAEPKGSTTCFSPISAHPQNLQLSQSRSPKTVGQSNSNEAPNSHRFGEREEPLSRRRREQELRDAEQTDTAEGFSVEATSFPEPIPGRPNTFRVSTNTSAAYFRLVQP